MLREVFNWGDSSNDGPVEERRPAAADINEADIVTSEMNDRPGYHKPVLDIDMPVRVVDSSTPGHHHLYIDKEMSWKKYRQLLKALVKAGIVEEGYLGASVERGFTGVRLPWVKKGARRGQE